MRTLEAGQAFRNAIEAEMAASRFYRLLAESTVDETARSFLDQMSAAEIAHAQAIEQRGIRLQDGKIPLTADANVEVIETVPDWKYVDNVSFEEALAIAKAAEVQAALYYDAIADSLNGELQEFFRELSREEETHARQIEERRAPHFLS